MPSWRPWPSLTCSNPRVNLRRFHRFFVGLPQHPNSKFRVRVTPAQRGRGPKRCEPTGENWLDKTPVERHASMTWMQRLKRVFNIDPEAAPSRPASGAQGRSRSSLALMSECRTTGVIERILSHLNGKALSTECGDATIGPCAAAGSATQLKPSIIDQSRNRFIHRCSHKI